MEEEREKIPITTEELEIPDYIDLLETVWQAVIQERERCAKIAETCFLFGTPRLIGKEIAAAIRKGE
jgi:hypothetical protein